MYLSCDDNRYLEYYIMCRGPDNATAPAPQLRFQPNGALRVQSVVAFRVAALLGIDRLLLPIDHLAMRIYSQNREAAILEYPFVRSFGLCPHHIAVAMRDGETGVFANIVYVWNPCAIAARNSCARGYPLFALRRWIRGLWNC